MTTPRAAVILAAGKSTRMKSSRSKVLHHVGGRSMLSWVADLARSAGADKIVCVVGEGNADVRAAAEELGLEIALQEPQLGTGHAVKCAQGALSGFKGNMAVLYADTPFVSHKTLERVFKSLDNGTDVTVLGFEPEEPGFYGRLITEGGELTAIVEARDASNEILDIGLCNSGVIAASTQDMFSALERVGNDNVKGEYYLTDIVEILRGDDKTARVITADESEVLGVNSRLDLATAEVAFQMGMRQAMLTKGVTLRDPDTTYFSWDTAISADAEIGANVVFGPGVSIAKDAVIHPFCHLEGAKIGEGAQIGPFARLRPGTEMAAGTKAGNFVETKKAKIGKGSKINHLSYIGDAEVGEGANIGAGTITCNYDGYFKHKTEIGDGAFVGTNSSLVAPVKIGKGAYLGSGGVITKDVPEGALAVARSEQVNKEGWADRYNTAQKKRKAKK
ncbi:bifunctional UDP-N-acetylglucosamine diphosphorylase/glucosamine-1-phosphate N-acetyltransferase GlmU [Hellea balneolensis]|uniref:bifunctional UDP-N-acetylglucosamine diphosphorylase/glucosamine-1-phosphate N-acetyltransferase GlmU n=1 Tax=Hellea balneolensis TaxID=287478 RepID=UPI0003F5BC3F|nr:bifunctional UDP-N-acetylglucosamine diphosphorylase/glucosamine-1-phosphate N-acetyltransferase GlmU [Hellea balneolensis]